MDVEIRYCGMWNYKPNAVSLADELKNDFSVDAKLVAGSGGIFDVIVDGKTVFSKSEVGRFPKPGEVTGAINGK